MTGTEVAGFAQMIRAMFARRRRRDRPGTDSLDSLDDVAQEAAVEVLETHRRRELPLLGNRRYYYQAGARAAGLNGRRTRSMVSFAEKQQKRADEWKGRVPIAGCGHDPDVEAVVDIPVNATPDARLRAAELRAATDRLMRLVAWHVQRCSEADRRALEVLLGIGTDQAEDSTEAAWRTGLSPGAISNAVRRLGKSLRADRRATRARRVMLSHMEERP